jgi:hypothetical protein
VYSKHLAIILGFALPLTILVIAVLKSHSVWCGRLRGMKAWKKAAAVLGLLVAVIIGGEKPQPEIPQGVVEILTRRADGSLTDLSGSLVSGVHAQAVADHIAASATVVHAADSVVSNAAVQCVALTNQILQADYEAAYIALDLPRGTPDEPNHNIMLSFERIEQTITNLTAYVWFSEMPSTNVAVNVEYSITSNVWSSLPPVSDSFPTTYTINGNECLKYTYSIPSGIAGTPLRPQYEIEFGGFASSQYLNVPETGVVVSTNGVDCLPFTGWDDYSSGTNSLLVRYIGGIAVEAVFNGLTIEGGE